MSDNNTISIVTKYFDLNQTQLGQMEQLLPLYMEWNEKINVISRKDIDQLMLHHVLHSLAIAKLQTFKSGSHVMDIGTGGGFPGIPLAILFPEVQFSLVDSIGKKIKVVNEVAKSIGLQNVLALNERAESVANRFDFIVSRATAPLFQLAKWSEGKLKHVSKHNLANGLICLKGGDLTEEIRPFQSEITLVAVNQYFTESFFNDKFVIHLPLK